MKVRMGPAHPVTQHLVAANEAALEIYRALGMVLLEDPAEGAAARHDRIEFLDTQRRRVNTARAEFDQDRDQFIEAAARAAGAKL
jgi:HD superfamily phosphohydrolase YqeK